MLLGAAKIGRKLYVAFIAYNVRRTAATILSISASAIEGIVARVIYTGAIRGAVTSPICSGRNESFMFLQLLNEVIRQNDPSHFIETKSGNLQIILFHDVPLTS